MREITDHSPSKYEHHRDCTLFLSFDEWAEVQGHEWIREATQEEVWALRSEITSPYEDEQEQRAAWDALFVDQYSGRPYMPVTVLRSAPGHIWRQASGHLRLFRFRENG